MLPTNRKKSQAKYANARNQIENRDPRKNILKSSVQTSSMLKPKIPRKLQGGLITGKEGAFVYFDPKTCAEKVPVGDEAWMGASLFVPSSVLKNDEAAGILTVKLPSGEVYKVNGRSAYEVSPQDDEGVEDILKLQDFSEMSLLHTLRVRYARDEMYTLVGPILISINPYKTIPGLYGDSMISKYHKSSGPRETMAPHLFIIAESAYCSLMRSVSAPAAMDQAIVISGESGAGKTESTKVIMAYLARITLLPAENAPSSSPSAKLGVNVGELEQKVLNTNPILEAFGNAKTHRNDNSSRFGKFIKIQFNDCGKIIGAIMEKYLLEKTRVQHQLEGERNFHIFYQLLRGLSSEEKVSYGISGSVDDFAYLSCPKSSTIKDVNDKEDFKKTVSCLTSVGVDAICMKDIARLLFGILQLGNIDFLEDDMEGAVGGVRDSSRDSLNCAADMLGVKSSSLLTALTKRSMYVSGSVIVKSQSCEQALEKRDSFSKSIYSMLFAWLVQKINSTISSPTPVWGNIGVLDIYGFENFENSNGFEQLLINYANEKLQNHFNKHIFQMEQQEYDSEGIDWSYIEFNDNQACVDLIEAKPNGKSGVFQTLDDVIASSRGDINASFIAQLNSLWGTGNHANFSMPRFNSDQRFGIIHYAGEVFYEVAGFAEKNKDGTNNDMKDLLCKSKNSLLQFMADEISVPEAQSSKSSTSAKSKQPSPGSRPNSRPNSPAFGPTVTGKPPVGRSRLKEDSISKQFSASLRQLYETLNSVQPHFVRCIKPNNKKLCNLFNSEKILLQLRFAGMMETIRIRQQGYSIRLLHADFFQKYSSLVPGTKSLETLVPALSDALMVTADAWQVGATKVFLRSDMSDKLTRLLHLRMTTSARKIQLFIRRKRYEYSSILIQKHLRRFVLAKRFALMKKRAIVVQTHARRIVCLRSFRLFRSRLVLVQTLVRRWLAVRYMAVIRNPLNRMTYDQIMEQITITHIAIDKAFSLHLFHDCDELQSKLKEMKTCLAKKEVPNYVPTTASDYEIYLLESRLRLEHAMASGNFHQCPFLQQRVKRLEAMRPSFPTLEDCDVEHSTVKEALGVALAHKDFKKCKELQARLLEIQTTKNSILATSPLSKISSDELDVRKSQLEREISTTLENNEFQACSELQAQLVLINTEIKSRGSSKDSAAEKLREYEEELKFAKSSENFLRIAEIQVAVKSLETLLSLSTNAKYSSMSHAELQLAISKAQQEFQASLDSKAYALCESLQLELDQMQRVLSSKVPADVEDVQVIDPIMTFEEIEKSLKEANEELQKHLALKDFKNCQLIEEKIDSLVKAKSRIPPLEIVQRSRAEVMSEIDLKKLELDRALKAREFKLCNSLNVAIVALEEELKLIPCAETILASISRLEQNLTEQIASKNFSKCDEIEIDLGVLRRQYDQLPDEEKAAASKSNAEIPQEYPDTLKCNPILGLNVPLKLLNPVPAGPRSDSQTKDSRPVSKLRPRTPLSLSDAICVTEVAAAMSLNRVDAALLVDASGAVTGIITDNDITRRVVSRNLDPKKTIVSDVMTKGPKSVAMEDSALDALEMMVENRFRHLPVVDAEGRVVGLLDIAKCIYDAVSVLEKIEEQQHRSTNNSNELKEAVSKIINSNVGGNKKKMQVELMQSMMEKMFGTSVPTLREIIGPSYDGLCQLSPSTTVRQASLVMAAIRKGVAIVEGSKLVGIFTPKDLVNRVIAKGLSPDDVLLLDVMTPDPDCVDPDLTLIDGLKEMHDQKYLHLPVCEIDSGRVVGIVDVMDLLTHSAGDSKSGGKGWRDFFNGAFELGGEDTRSDTSRTGSATDAVSAGRTMDRDSQSAQGLTRSKRSNSLVQKERRAVAKLRPRPPIRMMGSKTVYEVAIAMGKARHDAALIVDELDKMVGIITDNDIMRRVVAKFVDPTTAIVSDVMTKGPKSVAMEDSALDALEMMVENRFRHLPVVDAEGRVVGLLDIAKCIYDAVSVLEKIEDSGGSTSVNSEVISKALNNALQTISKGKEQDKSQILALKTLMGQMFGGDIPTLRSILTDKRPQMVRLTCNVREASIIMAESKKAILVCDGDKLVGIFTPKDLLNRVICKGKSPDLTSLSTVMTPNPDCFSDKLTILDALKEMHDRKYLHLPVRDEETGENFGVVDVMELLENSAGGIESDSKGWRDFFKGAMDLQDGDTNSVRSYESNSMQDPSPSTFHSQSPISTRDDSSSFFTIGEDFFFKVSDLDGFTHRIKCVRCNFNTLKGYVAEKLNLDQESIVLKYIDEENDQILISCDSSLKEAVESTKFSGQKSLKLIVDTFKIISSSTNVSTSNRAQGNTGAKKSDNEQQLWSSSKSVLTKGIGIVSILAIAGFVFMKSTK